MRLLSVVVMSAFIFLLMSGAGPVCAEDIKKIAETIEAEKARSSAPEAEPAAAPEIKTATPETQARPAKAETGPSMEPAAATEPHQTAQPMPAPATEAKQPATADIKTAEPLTQEPAKPTAEAEQSEMDGLALYKKGDYGSAILAFNAQLEDDAEDAYTLANRGLAYAARNEYLKALEDLYEASFIAKDDTAILHNIAAVHYLNRDYLKAIEIYDDILRLNKMDSAAYKGRAFAFMSMSKNDLAATDFGRALSINSEDFYTQLGMALALSGKGDFKTAIASYTGSSNLMPKDAFPYMMRAQSSGMLSKYKTAVADLKISCSLGYAEICTALKDAAKEIEDSTTSLMLQYARKSRDQELYELVQTKLAIFYASELSRRMNRYFSESITLLED